MPRGGHGGSGGSNTIRGSQRSDNIVGTSADEIIFGRNGNDTIDAGGGNDTVTGGAGADVFVINPGSGTVTITDFTDGVDLMDISAFGFDSQGGSAQYWGYLIADGNDTIIEFWDGNTMAVTAQVVLQNFSYTNIDIGDYIL